MLLFKAKPIRKQFSPLQSCTQLSQMPKSSGRKQRNSLNTNNPRNIITKTKNHCVSDMRRTNTHSLFLSRVKSNNKDNKTLALLPFYPLLCHTSPKISKEKQWHWTWFDVHIFLYIFFAFCFFYTSSFFCCCSLYGYTRKIACIIDDSFPRTYRDNWMENWRGIRLERWKNFFKCVCVCVCLSHSVRVHK